MSTVSPALTLHLIVQLDPMEHFCCVRRPGKLIPTEIFSGKVKKHYKKDIQNISFEGKSNLRVFWK